MGKHKKMKKKMNMAGGSCEWKRVLGKPNRRKWIMEMALKPKDWSQMNLEVVQKNFYEEHPVVKERNQDAVKQFMDQNKITVKGQDCPKPVQAFNEFNFSESIMAAIRKQNFVTPTPIQAQAIPVALSGRDLVAIAETGSGKTLAYILPALVHIHGKNRLRKNGEPDVVVLSPTRELAQQIHQVVVSLGSGIHVTSECFYGGTKRLEQKLCAEKVFEICIATPGRMVDFLYEELIKLHNCTYFVLDEADRMLDMGFEPQIKMVINQARPDRQMLMFSATWPPEIRNLAETYLKSYIMVNIGSLGISANHNIHQKVVLCEEQEKPTRIVKIMKDVMQQAEKKTLIFVNSKVDVDVLTLKFRLMGWEALGLHGSKGQAERDQVFSDFKRGKISILIATDLAARGLDVDDIKFIINYDYPNCSEDYVHRIGRTGRCNRTGTAITFFTSNDTIKASDLISVLEEAGQQVDEQLHRMTKLPPPPKKGKKGTLFGTKLRKKELKRLVSRSVVNKVPLGAASDTDCLPTLDNIDHLLLPPSLQIKSGKKKKKPQQGGGAQAMSDNGEVSQSKKLMTGDNSYPVKSNVSDQIDRSDFNQELNNRDFMYSDNRQWQQEIEPSNRMSGLVDMDTRNGNWGVPSDVGNMPNFQMSVNQGNLGMPMNYRNLRMPMSHGNMEMFMNRNMGMPMDSRRMGMAVNRRNMFSPMNSTNMGMPMNSAGIGMTSVGMGVPMNSRNDGSSSRTSTTARGSDNTVSSLSQNESTMRWHGGTRMCNSTYSGYMGHQNAGWDGYRDRYSVNRMDANCYSSSGYNASSNRYFPSGPPKMF